MFAFVSKNIRIWKNRLGNKFQSCEVEIFYCEPACRRFRWKWRICKLLCRLTGVAGFIHFHVYKQQIKRCRISISGRISFWFSITYKGRAEARMSQSELWSFKRKNTTAMEIWDDDMPPSYHEKLWLVWSGKLNSLTIFDVLNFKIAKVECI